MTVTSRHTPTPRRGREVADLTAYDAVLFDLDGVLTPTAEVHMRAWKTMFDELFDEAGIRPDYTDDDYFRFVDGKKRYEGVVGVLRDRGIEVPWGDPADPIAADTVCGIGNRKNAVFARLLREHGVAPFPGSLRMLSRLRASGTPMAVVSSSKNAEEVLHAAGIRDFFPVVVDGVVAEREDLPSKPAPDVFARAAELLGVPVTLTAAVEDATSGVAAAAAAGCRFVLGIDRGAGARALHDAGADVVVSDLSDPLTPNRGDS